MHGIQVGCYFLSLKDWEAKYKELGESHAFMPSLAQDYYDLMVLLQRIQNKESNK